MMTEFHLRIGVKIPQFVPFLECLFQTIAARLGDKSSSEEMCYWSLQFGRVLNVMSEVCDKAMVSQKNGGGNDIVVPHF